MRDKKGRFLKGESGNPSGRPRDLPPDEWLRRKLTPRGLANVIYEQVRAGNPTAMKLALEMMTNPPAAAESTSFTRGDLKRLTMDELRVLRQLMRKLEGHPVEDALASVRAKPLGGSLGPKKTGSS